MADKAQGRAHRACLRGADRPSERIRRVWVGLAESKTELDPLSHRVAIIFELASETHADTSDQPYAIQDNFQADLKEIKALRQACDSNCSVFWRRLIDSKR